MTPESPPHGLVLALSSHDSAKTIELLIAAITKRGIAIMARIDHAAAAAKAGLALRPTEVVIFGNANAGTPLMQTAQTIGIDLPLKALVFEDDRNRTWVAYNDPKWIAARHGIGAAEHVVDAMASALAAVVREAI